MSASGTQLLTLWDDCDNQFIKQFAVTALRTICHRAGRIPVAVATLPAGLQPTLQLIVDMFHFLLECRCKLNPRGVHRPTADTARRAFDALVGFRLPESLAHHPRRQRNPEDVRAVRVSFEKGMEDAEMLSHVPDDISNIMWNALEALCYGIHQVMPVLLDIESMEDTESDLSSLSSSPSR